MKIRKVTLDEVEIDLEPQEEDIPVRGNAVCSDNSEEDKEIEDKILAELEYNIWAWCCVKVTVSYKGFEGVSYLGACSYKDEKDFIGDSSYGDMIDEALDYLNRDIQRQVDIISELEVP